MCHRSKNEVLARCITSPNVLIDNMRSTGHRDHVTVALTRLSLQQYVPMGSMSRGPGSLFHSCFVFSPISLVTLVTSLKSSNLIVRKIYFTKFSMPQNVSRLSLTSLYSYPKYHSTIS